LNLYSVHRLLIRVFIVASVAFGAVMLRRWWAQKDTVTLVCGISAIVIALGALAYLLKAPYLRKK
jgi:hypothetical protein